MVILPSINMEEWKTVIESYQISNHGNCRRLLLSGKTKSISGSITNKGYKYFQLKREGQRTNYLIHQLVAKAFLGDYPDNCEIDHIDRDKTNNHISNLRYVSHKENMRNQDRYRDDILTMDSSERHRIFQAEYDIKTGHNRNIRRRKGTGQIYERENGKWRACITINKIKHDKTLESKELAEIFITKCLSQSVL